MFYDVTKFKWTHILEDNWSIIRNEYNTLSEKSIIWPEQIHNGKWYVIGFLFQNKEILPKHLAPVTSEICSNIPNISTYGFSIMKPGCEIIPHVGYTSDVLRCHLCLYTNDNCGLKVDGAITNYVEGKVTIFDDTKVHSAWNRGSNDRVVLLLDFKR